MNRHIFRAKANAKREAYDGEWIYGYLTSENTIKPIVDVIDDDGFVVDEDIYIIEKTLGQCIEHKDKNGVDIWEGDLIQGNCDYEYGMCLIAKAVIEYDKHECAYVAREYHGENNTLSDEHPIYENCDLNDIEVIGNIHEGDDDNA